MSMINQFLWVIFPYICLAVFIVGHIYRYRTDQFNWTAKSSEFIEKKHLKLGSLMFHLGIIPVIGGHVAGLAIPQSWMESLGISDHMYHIGAVYVGSAFGFLTLGGMVLLTARRFTIRNVRKLSTASDMLVNVLLLFIVFMGMYSTRWSERSAAGIQLSGNGLRVVPWIVYAPSGCFVDGERAAVV